MSETGEPRLVVAQRKPDGEWEVVRELDGWEAVRVVLMIAGVDQEEFDALSPDLQMKTMTAIAADQSLSLTPPPSTVH